MSLVINHNLMAMNASRNLGTHYDSLSTSVRRLSSGLRVDSAADDAAGLAIREMMRADISTINQGIRNANDAISMIQVADGALQVIDEKLIRMKELAEQAATGTYTSDQRLIINSEFQAMALEIQRISKSTDFNGVKLLDGSLSGTHDGTSLTSYGAAKIHFGTGNNSSEDYYYVNIADAGLVNLGLATEPLNVPYVNNDIATQGVWFFINSGVELVGVIPVGAQNVSIEINSYINDNDIQVFTRDGKHLAGTNLDDYVWTTSWFTTPPNNITRGNVNQTLIIEDNGFFSNAKYDDSNLIDGKTVNYDFARPNVVSNYRNMEIRYSGDSDTNNNGHTDDDVPVSSSYEKLEINNVKEDLIIISVGGGGFDVRGTWDVLENNISDSFLLSGGVKVESIASQELAQRMLGKIDAAIVKKDGIRANLGALQNRLQNTVSNLSIQAENLQASESRISDVDVATEMTEFVRHQVLTQSAVAMLAQANSLPRMALQLITG
ncbi:putative flagellin domain-containing protein [Megalodesulfovibrio gigas DSM 1382 = ATCC 19364]|uniref:Flagellin n=1 Tax=Megalodesulfovibrio gigas (strain ATCC 19364 / DSM 1382 / NCIMB 9332 / VKM B-1759) TaxID=1121448 RepID=T2GB80_MEGG1|nr:putative flagellin domain-containing protein [Megalodesulfovibrio gigas DSM 1382 = ATCC 19364]